MLWSRMVAKSIGGWSELQMSNLWIRCGFIYCRQLLRLSHRWPSPKFFLHPKIKKYGIITSSSVSCNLFHFGCFEMTFSSAYFSEYKKKFKTAWSNFENNLTSIIRSICLLFSLYLLYFDQIKTNWSRILSSKEKMRLDNRWTW